MTLNKSYFSKVFLILALALLPALHQCTKKKEIKGRNYVSREVMTNVMLDIHLIDGITNDMKYYRKYNPGDSINLYNEIFTKYKIDSAMYNRTLKEYSKHPDLLNDIYDDVLMELNLMLDRVNTEDEHKPPPDRPVKKEPIKKPDQTSKKSKKTPVRPEQ